MCSSDLDFDGVNGQYQICMDPTTGYLRLYFRSSTGSKNITSTTDYTEAGWVFVHAKINPTAGTAQFFINKVQVGSDLSFTGTFAATASQYRFYIGAGNKTATVGYKPARSSFANMFLAFSNLSDTDINTLYNMGYVSGLKGFWPCNNFQLNDSSGNGYHMTGVNLSATKMAYGATGSRMALDKGYTLYKKTDVPDLCIAYTLTGEPVTSPIIPADYYKSNETSEFAGNTGDRKSTRLNSSHVSQLVCRLMLENKKNTNNIKNKRTAYNSN